MKIPARAGARRAKLIRLNFTMIYVNIVLTYLENISEEI